jgi:maleate cis-trans isomerase
MSKDINKASRVLPMAESEAIDYGFTTATFYRGVGCAREIVQTTESVSEAIEVVLSLAIIEALAFFKAKKISIATPCLAWNNQVLLKFFS